MSDPITIAIETLLRDAATRIVMPRFRTLSADDIIEKSPGELVTIADREAELRIAEGLSKILGEARIVGEEATEADPTLLEAIDNGLVWLIDPIDGTSNFAEGKSPFALMIALLNNGVREGGWIYDPVANRFCHAMRGKGAFVNHIAVTARETGAVLPVAALATSFMTPQKRADVEARAIGKYHIVPTPRCSGEQYPRLVLGQNDVTLFERTLPWDHGAGALFLEEAGGVIQRNDGRAYMTGDGGTGLLGAASQRLWDDAARILFD
jgi:fructose-1,6-bisphosphatase/inositol monophosphatase family enzyme